MPLTELDIVAVFDEGLAVAIVCRTTHFALADAKAGRYETVCDRQLSRFVDVVSLGNADIVGGDIGRWRLGEHLEDDHVG